MYKLSDYLRNGLLFVNNTTRPRHKRLTQLMIYSTTICQSRCKHCNIWQKPNESLTLEDIKKVMASRCVTEHTVVGLEGGEFVLHPEADAIMDWFAHNHPHYTLLSNCLAAEKVIRAVKAHHPEHLYLSLDGDRETYKVMRTRRLRQGNSGHRSLPRHRPRLAHVLSLALELHEGHGPRNKDCQAI